MGDFASATVRRGVLAFVLPVIRLVGGLVAAFFVDLELCQFSVESRLFISFQLGKEFFTVDAAIEDRSIASIPAHKRFVLNGKGRLDVAIRQLPVGVPCMQNEIAVTAIECEA